MKSKKSEIRLKSELSHPCLPDTWNFKPSSSFHQMWNCSHNGQTFCLKLNTLLMGSKQYYGFSLAKMGVKVWNVANSLCPKMLYFDGASSNLKSATSWGFVDNSRQYCSNLLEIPQPCDQDIPHYLTIIPVLSWFVVVVFLTVVIWNFGVASAVSIIKF